MMAQQFGRRPEWKTDRSYALFKLYGRSARLDEAQSEADLNSVAGTLAQLYRKKMLVQKFKLRRRWTGAMGMQQR